MAQEYPNKITLLTSLALHTIVLISLPLMKHLPQKKVFRNLEVTYQASATGQKAPINRGGLSRPMKQAQRPLPKVEIPQKNSPSQQLPPLDLSKLFRPKETISIAKPQSSTPLRKKQQIKFSDIPVEMAKNPAYLSYRDKIRQRIQDKVYFYSDRYFYFDNPKEGKVFVSFTVLADGTLRELNLIQERSSSNPLLQKIALLAIQEAAPFEKFPPELQFKERLFNLEISFELE